MSDSIENLEPAIQEFLEQTLATDEFEVIPLAGDASNRQYHRIVVNDKSYALMSWEPFVDDNSYPFLSVLEHFGRHKVGVPKVIGKAPELGQVLLEDLGDLTLERKFWETQNQEHVIPFYHQAIDELIKIHYPASDDKNNPCTAFQVEFDTNKFLWEMNYGREHFLEQLAGVKFSPELGKSLDRSFLQICKTLDKEPKRISHRDYHSRNLMIKLGHMRVIDFQDARLGPIQYDLVSLMHDSYVDLEEETISKILDYYFFKAEEHLGQTIDRDHFFEIFYTQLIQRCFKACGSFASFYNNREDERYLKYLHPTIRKVAHHLEPFSEHKEFLSVLQDNGLLERDYTDL